MILHLTKTLVAKVLPIAITLLLLSHSTLKAQNYNIVEEFLGGKDVRVVNFEFIQGFILVDIKFKNLIPMKFIFDTGSTHTILFDKTIADIFGLDYDKKIEIYGADLDREIFAYIARNIELTLDDNIFVSRDILVLEEDYLLLEEMTGIQIDGIIGGSFFNPLVVEILYKKHKIKFYNPNTFKLNKSYDKGFDVEIKADKPYIKTLYTANATEQAKPLKLLIDSGAALTFLLHTNSDSTLHNNNTITRGVLGKGLGGELTGYIGKTYQIRFSQYHFDNLLTSYQDLSTVILNDEMLFRNGIIGNDILSRFDIILDYMRKKIYLKPHKNYNKAFKHDKSGLIIFSYGKDLNQYYVKDVIPLSPAYLAGIKKGDVIKKINFWSYKYWSFGAINKLFQKKEGKKIKLVVERKGIKKKIFFRLRDYIKK
jgi:hypothetical protein